MNELTDYGFTWGPMEVTRMASLYDTEIIELKTEHHNLQISVSPKGRSVRIWKDHKEIK